ncbi:MAG: hypothetical protein H6682_16745 [Candidatus Eisenbacteria bacterium]|nr:hypothetical protein [Candidatus Eisenbacteria bacterium]
MDDTRAPDGSTSTHAYVDEVLAARLPRDRPVDYHVYGDLKATRIPSHRASHYQVVLKYTNRNLNLRRA